MSESPASPRHDPDRAVSIKDVAQQAGVAISSVSRVLAGHPDVSPRMRDRVMHAVTQTGYAPNSLAQGLRRGTSMSIGFVVGDISNPLMSSIALAAETHLATKGYTLLLANSSGRAEGDAASIRTFRHRLVDGLLLSLSDEDDEAVRSELAAFDKPTVLLDRVAGTDGTSKILFDHAAGFRSATEHLIELGHRRIALIAGTPTLRHTRERVRAVQESAAQARLPEPTVMLGTLSRQQGHSAVHALMAQRWRPTAIICGGNQLLPGVLQGLRELALSIPEDISLITTDSTELAEFHSPPLACVTRDASTLGAAAAELLLRELEGGDQQTVILPTRFQDAASCAGPSRTRR